MMVSINRLNDGHLKDTAANIVRTKEFVVHMTDEAMAEQMHRCGERLPAHQSELENVGLHTRPSRAVAPLCIAEAPTRPRSRPSTNSEKGGGKLGIIENNSYLNSYHVLACCCPLPPATLAPDPGGTGCADAR
ncbi:hypothetical protein J2X15_003169 [Rhodoferax saidenbachensis]|uniref:Flavin reductase like domain-containing protein n=1 Tax=Rhodoferax saidenbachensis TaxID=1484693 RepID=A0ABU1ZQM2_9BURK|nr:hypothetical protein [Rhodoferax saidenbachensis]